jgi:hypothetical protein
MTKFIATFQKTRLTLTKRTSILGTLLLALISQPLIAADGIFTFTWENDMFSNNDGQYTNGIGFSYAHPLGSRFKEDFTPAPIYWLFKDTDFANQAGKRRGIYYQFGQLMFTPQDITRSDLIEDDRPYAGLLVWNTSLISFDSTLSDRWTFSLGLVGPAAFAKDVQTKIHEITDSDQPQGWDNQLRNEPVFKVERGMLFRALEFELNSSFGMDFLTFGSIGAGTLSSDAQAGISVRIGHSLDQTYPTFSSFPVRNANYLSGRSAHWQIFASRAKSYINNDITLDGNNFTDSHSVDLINERMFSVLGLSIGFQSWSIMLSYQESSKTFETQTDETKYGALSISTIW